MNASRAVWVVGMLMVTLAGCSKADASKALRVSDEDAKQCTTQNVNGRETTSCPESMLTSLSKKAGMGIGGIRPGGGCPPSIVIAGNTLLCSQGSFGGVCNYNVCN